MQWSDWLATQKDIDNVSMSELHKRHDEYKKRANVDNLGNWVS